jgi:dTDP-4-dehydrorhamnose reductase
MPRPEDIARHVVIGASGQVGQALMDVLRRRPDIKPTGTYLAQPLHDLTPLDMTDEAQVMNLVESVQPAVIWLPAALADVDRCEREPELSRRCNLLGPAHVLRAAEAVSAVLVFFSTDYVFDGVGGPFLEQDPVRPLQTYGRDKARAEELILRYRRSLVIRPAWIYSREASQRNFVWRLLNDAKRQGRVRAAVDQWSTPTDAHELALRAVDAVDKGMRGVLHLAGPDRLTRYALTTCVLRMARMDAVHVEPVELGQLALPAKRPLDGGLITRYPRYRLTGRVSDVAWEQLLSEQV